MERVCILIRSGPYGQLQAGEGVRHLIGAVEARLDVSALLVDDGVFVAKHGQNPQESGWTSLSAALRQALAESAHESDRRVAVYVHRPSMEQRGLDLDDLIPGVQIIDDDGLASIAGAAGLLIF